MTCPAIFLSVRKGWFLLNIDQKRKGKFVPKTQHLILCVFSLLGLFFALDKFLDIPVLMVGVFYIVVFAAPCVAYILLNKDTKSRVYNKMRMPPTTSTLMIVFATLAIICVGLLFSFSGTENGLSLYDAYIGKSMGALNTVLIVISFVLLPAILEEFLFRGILCAEFQSHGMITSVILSTLFFSFVHFNFKSLPVYIFAGIILSLLMYATKSVYAAMIVHLAYNLFGFYGQPYLTTLYKATGSTAVFVLLLIIVLIISLIIFCDKAVKLYGIYSQRAADNKIKIIDKTFRSPKYILYDIIGVLRTPLILTAVAIYITASILTLF